MIRLNIDQQTDEIRDIEDFIKEAPPLQVVELQAQQIRRLLYFAKKGVISYKNYKTRLNPESLREVNVEEAS
jgi:hypothetical protein